jgi:hypothetical protein
MALPAALRRQRADLNAVLALIIVICLLGGIL